MKNNITVLECKSSKWDENEFYCEFTDVCDEYNLMSPYLKDRPWLRTYLYDVADELEKGMKYFDVVFNREVERDFIYIAFRVPGATRGSIKIDKDHIIQDILFYPDTCFGYSTTNERAIDPVYKPQVVEATKKFIGMKIVIKNDEK